LNVFEAKWYTPFILSKYADNYAYVKDTTFIAGIIIKRDQVHIILLTLQSSNPVFLTYEEMKKDEMSEKQKKKILVYLTIFLTCLDY